MKVLMPAGAKLFRFLRFKICLEFLRGMPQRTIRQEEENPLRLCQA